eukprot:3413064-Pyramimonas_sp.AAC.2
MRLSSLVEEQNQQRSAEKAQLPADVAHEARAKGGVAEKQQQFEREQVRRALDTRTRSSSGQKSGENRKIELFGGEFA